MLIDGRGFGRRFSQICQCPSLVSLQFRFFDLRILISLSVYEPKDADEYAKLKELKDLLVQELPKRLCERVYPSFSELSNADQVSLRSGLEAAVREESDAIFSIYTRQVSSTLSIDQPTDKSSSTRQLNELITVDQEARLAELRHEALISEIFEDTFVRAPM